MEYIIRFILLYLQYRKYYNMKLKKVNTTNTINNFLDPVIGEVIETTKDVKHVKVIVSSQEMFFWTYSSILGLIDELTKTEMKLVYYAGLNAQFNKNIINFSKPMCVDVEKTIGLSYQTIKNTLSSLVTKKIMIPLGSGCYRVNPRYYWRGDSKHRSDTMKFILEMECPDCLSSDEVSKVTQNTDFVNQTSTK